MKVIVHIRHQVEVDVPDSLIPARRDRWSNNAMQRYAVDAALDHLHRSEWRESKSFSGVPYQSHPALGWIEYPKKEMTSGVI